MVESSVKSYRADVDGLRAVAVLAVLLFHGFPELLRGGFVGVDIFFVISGYLITGILLENLDRGGLSLVDFYRHRMRRIFPALVVVLTACFAFGSLVLFADEFAQLGKHIAASAVFVSNFVLWGENSYFDVISAIKPLLHLWSLAVEEQFYLVWPLLLWLAWRLRLPPLGLAGLCVGLSFAACVTIAGRDATADFYSPLTRFWEILVGAMLVSAERSGLLKLGAATRLVLSLAGAALVAASIVFLGGSEIYPGGWAAVPVLGSLLLLAAGPLGFINRWILAWRPLVAIGLISYPLYLWHWPVLAFARLLAGSEPPAEVRVALLAASLVPAALTFVAIEWPLRFGAHATIKAALLCALMVVVGGAGLDVWMRDGLHFRSIAKHAIPSGGAALDTSNPFVADCKLTAAQPVIGWCHTDTREPPRYAVLGDSHGDALFWALVRASEPQGRWQMAGRWSCAPMSGMQRVTRNERPDLPADDPIQCAALNAAALGSVLNNASIRVVLIVATRQWLEHEGYAAHMGESPVDNGGFKGLAVLVNELQRAGKQVVFLIDNPVVGESRGCVPRPTGFSAFDEMLARFHDATCNLRYDRYASAMAPYLDRVAALKAGHPGLTVFDPTPLLCDVLSNNCPMFRDGKSLYSYGDHISNYGGDLIAAGLTPVIQSLSMSSAVADQPASHGASTSDVDIH
jgi:peptidoglycan/LPS O-acetylase OafA/YrhL